MGLLGLFGGFELEMVPLGMVLFGTVFYRTKYVRCGYVGHASFVICQ